MSTQVIAGVPSLGDAQDFAGHRDPRTTRRYDPLSLQHGKALVGALPGWEHVRMEGTGAMPDADEQIAEALAAERESLSTECRVDAARLEQLLAPDFHEFGASGGEHGFEGAAARVASYTSLDDEPITTEDMRGWLLADGLVMVKYTSENQGRRSNRTSLWRRVGAGHWQMFHHQGTIAVR
jgi:hypothetical protein